MSLCNYCHPMYIVGDETYGSDETRGAAERLMLHARMLRYVPHCMTDFTALHWVDCMNVIVASISLKPSRRRSEAAARTVRPPW